MILEGNITIPYKWTTGPAVGRFLGELRDNARIMGARCDACEKVYAPPSDVCGECYRPLETWVELSGEGTVVAVSVVDRRMPWSPVEPPYNLGLIKLDGADTSIVHLVGDEINSGDRVRAVFNRDRTGSLLDILRFAKPEYRDDSIEEVSPVSTQETGRIERAAYDVSSLTETDQVFQALPVLFKKYRTEKQLTYYFSIDGDQWTVEVGPEACTVRPGKVDDADCFLKTTREIFLGTIKGDYTPSLSDLMSGKVKTNNPFLLQTFKNIFVD